jgi:rubrerythrin
MRSLSERLRDKADLLEKAQPFYTEEEFATDAAAETLLFRAAADALDAATRAIATAWPYVNGVALDHGASPWRRETAQEILATLQEARDLLEAALSAEVALDVNAEHYVEAAAGADAEAARRVVGDGEMYFVCQVCAHTVLAVDPDKCESCGSKDLIGFYNLDDAEYDSQCVLAERRSAVAP